MLTAAEQEQIIKANNEAFEELAHKWRPQTGEREPDLKVAVCRWYVTILASEAGPTLSIASFLARQNTVLEQDDPFEQFIMIMNLDKEEWTKKLEATGLSHDQAAAIVDIIALTITCDYSGQTRDKLLEDLMPMASEWVIEGIKHSALCFQKSKDEPVFYCHMEVRDTQDTIDGEPVLVCLILWVERGVVKAATVCHIGSKKNVRAREAEYRHFMKEMAAEDKGSSFMQIDQEGGQPDSWLAGR